MIMTLAQATELLAERDAIGAIAAVGRGVFIRRRLEFCEIGGELR